MGKKLYDYVYHDVEKATFCSQMMILNINSSARGASGAAPFCYMYEKNHLLMLGSWRP